MFFEDDSPTVFNHDPAISLFLYNCFFASGNDMFHGLKHFFRNQIVALASLRVPFKWMIGVSVQGTLKPCVSP